MSQPSEETVQEKMAAAGGGKSGCRNCCLFGCLGMIILTVVASVAAYFYIPHYVRRLRDQYTDTEPMALPQVETTEAEVARIRKRLDDFGKTVEDPKAPGVLVLTAEDINKLIAKDPGWQKSKVKCYVTIDGDQITGQFSVPFDAVATTEEERQTLEKFGLKGRYLNASGTIKARLQHGVLVVTLEKATVKGKPIPEYIMAELRKKNLAEDLPRQNPDAAKALAKLDSIEVKDGKIFIKSKAAAAGEPPMAPDGPR